MVIDNLYTNNRAIVILNSSAICKGCRHLLLPSFSLCTPHIKELFLFHKLEDTRSQSTLSFYTHPKAPNEDDSNECKVKQECD
jgi:hypothetical protein